MSILEEVYKALDKPPRVKEHFYVTDLGTCYRKVIMNFGEHEKKELTNAEKIMFHKANSDHEAMTQLLQQSKRFSVMEVEMNINAGLPDIWHGRLDVLVYDKELGEMFPIDWKGTRSLRYQQDLPKTAHKLQLRAYIMALAELGYPVGSGKIIYVDRTGSFEGVEFDVEANDTEVLEEMIYYEACKTVDLPPILPREIKQTKDEFHLVPNWQCGYCYYQPSSCQPNMSKNKIATLTSGELSIKPDYTDYADQLHKMLEPKDYEHTPKGFSNFVKEENK